MCMCCRSRQDAVLLLYHQVHLILICSFDLSICLLFDCSSLLLSLSLSTYLSAVPVYLLSLYLPICPSSYSSIHASNHPSIYLSVYLSILHLHTDTHDIPDLFFQKCQPRSSSISSRVIFSSNDGVLRCPEWAVAAFFGQHLGPGHRWFSGMPEVSSITGCDLWLGHVLTDSILTHSSSDSS